MRETVSGIVLRQVDYKDNDYILKILTTNNQLFSLYAKGVKKATSKNSYGCSLFAQSMFVYEQKDNKLPYLITATTQKIYKHIFQDYDRMICASVIANIMEEILTQENNVSYPSFNVLQQYFQALEDNADLTTIMAVYLANVLKFLGIELSVDGCAVCNNTSVAGISIAAGGFVCSQHQTVKERYSLAFLKQFRLINKATIEELPLLIPYQPFDQHIVLLLKSFLETYSGLKLSTFKFIDSVFSI